jgi:hypothetical protein
MKKLLGLVTLTAVLSLVLTSSAAAHTFGGHATAVQVTVPATGTIIRAASGTLSITGGAVDAALLVGDVPSDLTAGAVALQAGTLHSTAVGLGDQTNAESSLANVNLTISGNQITADFLMARSTASCGPGPAVAGSSQLASLVINGQAITVTGDPNQTVTLPNGTAIINEQLPSVVGSSGELTVNALYVSTRDAITGQPLADVWLATVDAKIDCQTSSPPTESFTSGGGWIPGLTAGKATFGVFGGIQADQTLRGHLVFKDHGLNFSMKSTVILTVVTTTPCQVTVTGSGESNAGMVNFTVTVKDNGEPGSADTFEIHVSGDFTYDRPPTLLDGGNIQAHGQMCG